MSHLPWVRVRVPVLLHSHPARTCPRGRRPCRPRTRKPGKPGELERRHDPCLAAGVTPRVGGRHSYTRAPPSRVGIAYSRILEIGRFECGLTKRASHDFVTKRLALAPNLLRRLARHCVSAADPATLPREARCSAGACFRARRLKAVACPSVTKCPLQHSAGSSAMPPKHGRRR